MAVIYAYQWMLKKIGTNHLKCEEEGKRYIEKCKKYETMKLCKRTKVKGPCIYSLSIHQLHVPNFFQEHLRYVDDH